MEDDLCIGIMLIDDQLEVATRQAGREETGRLFLADARGVRALREFALGFRRPLRVAVAGTTAIGVALALSTVPDSEFFVVSPTVAAKPIDLARYAERTI